MWQSPCHEPIPQFDQIWVSLSLFLYRHLKYGHNSVYIYIVLYIIVNIPNWKFLLDFATLDGQHRRNKNKDNSCLKTKIDIDFNEPGVDESNGLYNWALPATNVWGVGNSNQPDLPFTTD